MLVGMSETTKFYLGFNSENRLPEIEILYTNYLFSFFKLIIFLIKLLSTEAL